MSLNTGFFAAYNHRYKQSNVGLNNQLHVKPSKRIRSLSRENQSFLPMIDKTRDHLQQPHRRNDFANNHLFVTKHKLAKFLSEQTQNDSTKAKNQSIKRRDHSSETKSLPTLDQDVHLSIINLNMKPTRKKSQPNRRQISHRTPCLSPEWINPISRQNLRALSIDSNDDDDYESYTIVNQIMGNHSDMINPVDSSVSYLKSIIPSYRS